MDTIKVAGIAYVVIGRREFSHDGETRIALLVHRPKGNRTYQVVQYSTGDFSNAVPCGFIEE